MAAIDKRQAAEASYTAWWVAELSKRRAAEGASNLANAGQRSGMQKLTVERLDRGFIAPAQGSTEMSKYYAAQESSKSQLGGKSAGQLAEVQAMQRQMAMMSLWLPMLEKQNALDIESHKDIIAI